MRALFRRIGHFRHDSSGNIAVIFTLAQQGVGYLSHFTASGGTGTGVMNKSSMTVTGSSTAVTRMPQYIDFHLPDNSPSMGVGATQKDRDDLVAATTGNSFKPDDKCAFACHDVSKTNNYYKLAKDIAVRVNRGGLEYPDISQGP